MRVFHQTIDVLQAARDRMSLIFDNFDTVNVSISSGKDSTVLYYLALQEAIKRGRKIQVFFLDQEAEYAATIDIIRKAMVHPNVIPVWYQVPLYMTNSTSYTDYFLYAWGEGEQWMRSKDPIAIHSIDQEYPKRFYEFFGWYEKKDPNAAYLVGLRAEESITRYRAVTKFCGWGGLKWSTTSGQIQKFYPIYDWSVYDVWKFIYDYNLPYNKIYDLMYWDNQSIYSKMRVSNLIHEKSYKCLIDLPRYEPDTFNTLSKRISGISTAARYASEKMMFNNSQLPSHYSTWEEFRNFLLTNIPTDEHRDKFIRRFANQDQDERTYRLQVGQLLINDYENSRSFDTTKNEKVKKLKEKWTEII
jgi:predicted phosphoadenosine phosphosulfate sulfurtransferase